MGGLMKGFGGFNEELKMQEDEDDHIDLLGSRDRNQWTDPDLLDDLKS
jgi:hypothetical protein